MYSGLTLTRFSGRLLGGHQKVDRVARRHLAELLPENTSFPKIGTILHFEGKNGPDGIKRKSPAQNEPWHYLDPLKGGDPTFSRLLHGHYENLVKELRAKNNERAGFEAAWLAHAIVDGMTPAHHYPYEALVKKLRGGSDSPRNTVKKKLVFSGKTKKQTLINTLKAYGPRGLYMGHVLFELGFGWIIKPLRFPDARPSQKDVKSIEKLGDVEYFMSKAREVAIMNLFELYLKKGWTSKLTRDIRQKLAPLIVTTVTTMWYQAALEAKI